MSFLNYIELSNPDPLRILILKFLNQGAGSKNFQLLINKEFNTISVLEKIDEVLTGITYIYFFN